MGLSISKYVTPVKNYVTGRKRKLEADEDDEAMYKSIDETLQTPVRKKLRTAQYIYQTLFKEGKNSDVTVVALGKHFRLHKVYLCQSPYFASMFGGSWLESNKNYIPIEIVDSEINVDALNIVLGSLYLDEIVLEPLGIVSVLATSTLFQLENIIDQCVEVMLDTINPKTVVDYYNSACEYGVQKIKDETFKWLEVNLLNFFTDRPLKLEKFTNNLLTLLVSSPNLFVLQTEFSLYMLLRMWLYTKISSCEKEALENSTVEDVAAFFINRKDDIPYLLTTMGQKYVEPFKALRIKNLLLHYMDIEVIHRDNIIPKSWLQPEILEQWYATLRINQNVDIGPKKCADKLFLNDCLRCGRVVKHDTKQMWRWTGFHFGLDVVVITDSNTLWVKRNHRPEIEQMLSFQVNRNLIIRVTVASIDDQLRIRHIQSTGIESITCTRNEEIPLLIFDKELKFPLLVSVNLMLTSPTDREYISENIITELEEKLKHRRVKNISPHNMSTLSPYFK